MSCFLSKFLQTRQFLADTKRNYMITTLLSRCISLDVIDIALDDCCNENI